MAGSVSQSLILPEFDPFFFFFFVCSVSVLGLKWVSIKMYDTW